MSEVVDDRIAIEVDAHGSPATVEAATWLVCFVPGLQRQWWHRFAHARHKHVFALRPLADGTWLLMEPWWTRMMVNVLTLDQAVRFLQWSASGDVLQVCERIPGRGSQLRGWANCSVLVAYMLGRRYWTWTPNGLYRKLQTEPDVASVNVAALLRQHFLSETRKHAQQALASVPAGRGMPLQSELLALGAAIVATMTSCAAVCLHNAAIAQTGCRASAADAFWTTGPEQVVERIRKVLAQAKRCKQIDIEDCVLSARRFLAMLRGHLHLEITLGLRAAPRADEVRHHVQTVVETFLRGVQQAGLTRDCASDDEPHDAQGLMQEIGQSMRQVVRGDDWKDVAGWAEVLWSGYVACTGVSWAQASVRIRRAWEREGGGSDLDAWNKNSSAL